MFFHSLHALLEDRVPPGLTDDKIGPLHDDDADEEGCVAGELHNLPLLIGLRYTFQKSLDQMVVVTV